MLNIGFYCTSVSKGGLELNMLNTAAEIKRQGYTISILCLEESPLHRIGLNMGLKIILVKKSGKYFDFTSAKILSAILLRNQITTLIVFHNYDTDTASFAKLFNKNIKLYYHQNMQIGRMKKDVFHNLRYKRYDGWITPLEKLANEVREMTNFDKNKIYVVPIGIESDKYLDSPEKHIARNELGLPLHKFIIGIIGRIDEQKGQLTAIKALEMINDENLILLIAGEPTINEGEEYLGTLLNYIEFNNLRERVIFKNFIPKSEYFYSAIDAFCLPSYSETYGLVTIEAMISGVPILASNSGGTPDVLDNGKYGILFTPKNIDSLKEAITFLINNYPEQIVISNKAKDYALNRFSKSNEARTLINLFNGDYNNYE